MKKTVLLFIFSLTGIQISAQDTLVFSQKKSSMFSNKYFIYPKTSTFEHIFKTDDGQIWYGKGTYKTAKRKIYLNFGDSENEIKKETQIVKIYDQSKKTDTLVIQFYDKKESPPMGHIKYKEDYFYADFEGLIKIPKVKFDSTKIPIVETLIQGTLVNIELTELTKLNTLKIYAYDIYSYYHFESNFRRVLKFNSNEMKSEDFYRTTNKRNVTFELLK